MALIAIARSRDHVCLMMFGDGDGWWFLMWIWMAAFWLLILIGCGAFFWNMQQPRHESSRTGDILKQRLARGEIDVEQYRALGAELGSGGVSPVRGSRLNQTLLFLLAVLAVVTLLALPAVAAARSDWDWFDHMGGMMNRGSNTADSQLVNGGDAEVVTINDLRFSPGNLRVPVGATVTWMNNDSVPHDATARDRSWETETLSRGEDDSVTFTESGVYDYYCTIHPSMKARVSVE
jgi:plastocyanin